MTLIDTNVLIDILTGDAEWLSWSVKAFISAAESGQLMIGPIVYGELAPQFTSHAIMLEFLSTNEISLAEPSREALYLAGTAFHDYRQSGGTRARLLPDFLIGAQAEDLGCAVLTRDPRPFRAYFPRVRLITPDLAS